jgi:hypothetical protein
MRLTFSLKTTRNIIGLFRVLNSLGFIIPMAALETTGAAIAHSYDYRWIAIYFGLGAGTDYLRIAFLMSRRGRRKRV